MPSIMRYINRIARLSQLYRDHELRRFDLSGLHHTYILNICRNPGIRQEKLANIIFVNKSNVTRQLVILEKKGYVIRKSDAGDARKISVFPTEKATAIYSDILTILEAWNDSLLEEIPLERREQLVLDLALLMEKSQEQLKKIEELNK